MTRLHLLLTLACVAGAAATVAATSASRSSPTPPAAAIAPGKANGVPVKARADQVAWLAGFGTYNARQGTWNLAPNPRGC
jgi:hypothetical protein